MRFVIVTGMSGAGKTQVLHFLEDIGFYCIDNMPPIFLTDFAKACYKMSGKVENAGVVIDIRGGEMFDDIEKELDRMSEEGFQYEVLFLDAKDSTLIKRYKETRRMHPLAKNGDIAGGINLERERLNSMRQKAKYIIDTSNLLTRDLKQIIMEIFVLGKEKNLFTINIQSFGFKYGIPVDSDLVFDVRFLPNPFYVDNLKPLTGLDEAVSSYVMGYPQSKEFLNKLTDMMLMLIPHYIKEGKQNLVISIGCTGGKHRSVTIAEKLKNELLKNDYKVEIKHADMHKD